MREREREKPHYLIGWYIKIRTKILGILLNGLIKQIK